MTYVRAWSRYTAALPLALALLHGGTLQAQGAASGEPPRGEQHERSGTLVGHGGVRLTVHEAGPGGGPAVVFIHGFTQNALTWDRQLRGELAARHHLVAYDLPGHGASEKPLTADRYTDGAAWAHDLAAVIRDRRLERPIVVGWSYGGWVIADYVRRYGDAQLGGLVFVAASAKLGGEAGAAALTDEVLSIFGDVLSPEPRASIPATRALVDMFATRGTPEWDVAFASAMMVPPEVRLAMFSRVVDNDDVLGRIRVPTLVVHGDRDRILRVSTGRELAARIPGARLLVYEQSGHAPHLDAAERFNRDLAEFVANVTRTRGAQ